jgi:eukaryotic-like serine/threonine-protein kinase
MPTPPMQGHLLAKRYRLLEPLGRGGMGVVWQGRDELLGRDVAVKEVLLPPELTDEERDVLRQRTMREARSAARLSHPNVVTMYDVVEEDGRPWIVMELVRSRSLAELIRKDGPLPPGRVADIGLQALAALEVAHPAGVLHRDVKPSNVLLADDGRVVLTDFGIATLEGDPSITKSGTLLGSPAYIAPERVRARGAGPESDLWSLGATLYTAVEGRPPYDRGSPLATLTAAVTQDPDPPQLAGPLWPVLEGLLRRDPAERLSVPEAKRLLQRAARTPQALRSIDRQPTPMEAPAADGNTDHGERTRVLAIPQLAPTPDDEPASSALQEPPSTPVDVPAGPPSEPPPPVESQPPPAESQPAPAEIQRGPGTRRRAPLVAVLTTLAVVAGALIGWSVWRQGDRGDNQAQQPSGSSRTVAPPATGASTAQASQSPASDTRTSSTTSAEPTRPPTTSSPTTDRPTTTSPTVTDRPSSPPATSGGRGVVPAGFERYDDPTGFSLAVPTGWTPDREGSRVYFREPGGSRLLLIDQTDQPKDDPVADWTQQERARRSGYRDYERIRIAAVDYFRKAADWEFTYAKGAGRVHVLNRGTVTSDDQAYGIYWSTPDSQWQDSLPKFRVFTETFQPAP